MSTSYANEDIIERKIIDKKSNCDLLLHQLQLIVQTVCPPTRSHKWSSLVNTI